MWYKSLIGAKQYQVSVNIFWFLLHHVTLSGICWPDHFIIFSWLLVLEQFKNHYKKLNHAINQRIYAIL